MHRQRTANHGLTFVEVLTVIIVVAVLAGIVVPILHRGRGEAVKIECTGNLKNIYAGALTFANKREQWFPLAGDGTTAPRAHESLNVLLRSNAGRDLSAMLFTCPAGDQAVASMARSQTYLELDEDTLSYAWAAQPVRNFGNAKNLSSDKFVDGFDDHAGHVGEVMLLTTDNSIQAVDKDDLDENTRLPPGLVR